MFKYPHSETPHLTMSQGQTQEPEGGGEWESLKTPPQKDVQPVPEEGSKAPYSSKISLPNGKPTLIVFLRHCGCPCKSTVTTRRPHGKGTC